MSIDAAISSWSRLAPKGFISFYPPLRSFLPHLLQILLQKLPRNTSLRDLPRETRLSSLLNEPQATNGALPVADILSLYLDQRHSRILRSTSVHTVAQVAKPCVRAPAVKLLDPRVGAAGGGDGAAHADPILRAAVLKGDLRALILFEIRKLVAVNVA